MQISMLWTVIVALLYPEFINRTNNIWVPAEKNIVKVQGTLIKKEDNQESTILYLKNIWVLNNEEVMAAEGQLPVYLAKDFAGSIPELGKQVQVSGIVKSIQEAPNPGNFNQKLYYQRKKIYWLLNQANIESVQGTTNCFLETLWKLQKGLVKRIQNHMSERTSGVLIAMLLGNTSYMDAEVKEYYQKAGIGHLYAISSLHMNFWGLGLYTLVKRLGGTQRCAVVSGIIFLAVYMTFTGMSISAIRAFLMYSIRMGATLLGREYDGLTAISVAAMIQLIFRPLTISDAGFLLSYAAVIGIFLLGPAFGKIIGNTWGIPLAVQVSLLPIMFYFYYEINTYSFLWNMVAVPIASILLISGVMGMIFPVLLIIPNAILSVYEKICIILTKLPGSKLIAGKPTEIQILIFYVCVWIAICFLKKKGKYIPICVFAVIGITGLVLPQHIHTKMQISMINVGQGDCFFVKIPLGKTCLIDGGSSTVKEVGKYRIESFLKCQGVGKLDYVFVSHGDEDHIGGITELIERQNVGVTIKCLVLPPKVVWDDNIKTLVMLAKKQKIPIKILGQGQKMKIGRADAVCVWPGNAAPGNEASMVISLTYKKFDMLFTGDLENESEEMTCSYMEELMGRQLLPSDYEVLKVGHHGSRNSTSEYLLALCTPEVAMISAGANNRYGHPHEEVVSRLAKRGINRYNTLDGNAVNLYTDGEKYYILEP